MAEIFLPLTTCLSQDAIEQLELFRTRFRELWSNWESLKRLGLSIGGSFSNLGDGKVNGPGCGVEIHRLKGFYLDFRFFCADKEPTQYFKISSLIGKHCNDDRLHRYLAKNKEQWNDAGFLHEWHGIKPNEMIDVLFNGELFHSEPDKRERMGHIRSQMSNELAHHCLVFSVYRRMLVIRNINWIVLPLSQSNQVVRIPAE